MKSKPLPQQSGGADHDWEQARVRLTSYFAHRWITDPQEAAAETLQRMVGWLQGKPRVQEEEFRKIVFGIAKNVLYEYTRKGWRVRHEVPLDTSTASRSTLGLNPQEVRRLVEQLFGTLSEQDCQLILGSLEMPQEELAKELGISVSSLRVKLHRAKKKLRKLLVKKILDQAQ